MFIFLLYFKSVTIVRCNRICFFCHPICYSWVFVLLCCLFEKNILQQNNRKVFNLKQSKNNNNNKSKGSSNKNMNVILRNVIARHVHFIARRIASLAVSLRSFHSYDNSLHSLPSPSSSSS